MEFVLWFNEISKDDIDMVGGKGANLGEIYNLKLPVPPGFVVTSDAYKYFLERSRIDKEIYEILGGLDIDNPQVIMVASEKIQRIILNTEMPDEVKSEIIENYDNLNVDEGLKDFQHYKKFKKNKKHLKNCEICKEVKEMIDIGKHKHLTTN